jgi:hypothetical protein
LRNRPILRFLILAGITGLVIAPFLWWGNPSGHDFEFHMDSWMDVLNQWKHGIVYPHWAALAHWGYGEARFIFYPPGSWTLGAGLGAILPWKIVPGAYCWIVLTLAGLSMYELARQWLAPPDALFAAAFYAANPYHLLILYWRSAFAELLAAVLVPLVVLCLVRLKEPSYRSTLWLSLTLAAAWLTNVPAAVMIWYSAAGLAVLLCLLERSVRPVIKTAMAMLLGVGLSSFYLVPAIYEQRWASIEQVLSPGVRPQDNFLLTTIADSDHNRFNLLVSYIAISEIAVLAVSIWYASRKRFQRSAWLLFSVWGGGTALVMFSVSNALWEHLPKFRFVQLPFRWLLCMNAGLAMLLAIATRWAASPEDTLSRSLASFRDWTARGMMFSTLLMVIVLAGRRTQPPWWDNGDDIVEMSKAISDGTGYEGTDEYVPAGADPSELKRDLPRVSDDTGRAIDVDMTAWDATEKHFVARAARTTDLTVRLFNYPAWRVLVNGKHTEAQTSEVTGLMVISVAAGESDVRIYFARTRDRAMGEMISLISICVFGIAWLKTRSRSSMVLEAEL